MKHITFLISALCILFYSFSVYAQNDDGTELLKPFRAKLAESIKKNSLPILPILDTNSNIVNYNIPEHIILVKYPEPIIRPLAMPVEKPNTGNSFYTKVGIGYPISPIIELSYHNKENKNLKIGANFNHLSTQGNINNQTFGNTHFDLGGTYFTKNGIAAGSKLGFNLDAYRFYGHNELSNILPDSLDIFPDTMNIPKDSVSQRFFEFFGNLHLFNSKINNHNVNYRADADFYVMNDKYGASEFAFLPKIEVDKWFGNGKQKQRLFFDWAGTISSFNNDSTGNARTLVNFRPGTDLNFGFLKTRLAMNLGSSESSFFILPNLRISLGILEGMLNIYASWEGHIKTNTFRSLSLFNPFISSELELRHTRVNDINGGLSGNIRGIGYDIKASYAMTRDLPLFINDINEDYIRFNLLYDTLNIISFKGTFDYKAIKNLSLNVTLGYNIYNGGRFKKAYHLPVFESGLSAIYQVKQLVLKSEIFYNSGVPYIDLLTGDDKILNALFDLNLSASYWFGKEKQNFGTFIELNNLLNNKNQRWYLYPQIGLNARLGILAKF